MGAAMQVVQMAGTAVKTGVEFAQIGEEYSARIAEDNELQRQSEEAAADARDRGRLQESLFRIRTGQAMERARVSYANSGVDSTTGTPGNVLADTRMMTELDAQTLKNNAAREALGYENQAKKAKRQREADIKAMRSKQTATILGGLADFAGGGMSGSGQGSAGAEIASMGGG